jgi:hypothetical protein
MIADFLSRCVDLFSSGAISSLFSNLGASTSLPILPLFEGSPTCLPAGGWRRHLSPFYLGCCQLSLSYDVVGVDSGSVRCGRFVEEAAIGHEGGGNVGVGSQSHAREDKPDGASGHPGDGGCCCREQEKEEDEGCHYNRERAKDAGCGEEEIV